MALGRPTANPANTEKAANGRNRLRFVDVFVDVFWWGFGLITRAATWVEFEIGRVQHDAPSGIKTRKQVPPEVPPVSLALSPPALLRPPMRPTWGRARRRRPAGSACRGTPRPAFKYGSQWPCPRESNYFFRAFTLRGFFGLFWVDRDVLVRTGRATVRKSWLLNQFHLTQPPKSK